MKRLLIALVSFAVLALAQAPPHRAVLSWNPTPDSSTATYNVYRASATFVSGAWVCGTPAKIGATAAGITTYTDTAVVYATSYCWDVTAVVGTAESVPSNTVVATIPLAPGSGLGVVCDNNVPCQK